MFKRIMKTVDKKRDYCFDFIKGILIFLVVYGHAIQMSGLGDFKENPINIWIYSFHMPLFIAISGFFSQKTIHQSFIICVKNKIERLLVPALIWTLIALLYHMYINQVVFSVRLVMQSIHNIWFLYCLFCLTILANVIWKLKYPVIISIVFAIILIAVYPYNNIPMFHALQITRQWPEFLIGLLLLNQLNVMKSVKCKDQKFFLKVVGIVILFFIYIYWYYNAAILHNQNCIFDSNTYVVRIIIQITSTILFFNLFCTIYKFKKNKVGVIEHLGSVTMPIYLMHPYIIQLFIYCHVFDILPGGAIVVSVASIIICIGIYKIIQISPFLSKILFGQ